MRCVRLLLALLLLSGACRHPGVPVVLPDVAGGGRVLLVSFDGVSADEVDRRLQQGQFSNDGLRAFADHGLIARVVPVDPSVTATAHVSIATGTTPARHGIVSNTFHSPGQPPNVSTSGFDAPIEAETIWEAARRAGKKVGTITFPGLDGTNPRRSADWGLIYTNPISKGKLVTLHRNDFVAEWFPPGWQSRKETSSFSAPMRATVRWSFVVAGTPVERDIELTALDSTNDGKENYDRIFVAKVNKPVPIDAQRWFAVSETLSESGSPHLFGSWSKILRLDPELDEVVIYLGSVSRNQGYPGSYRALVDREAGFWPGPADDNSAREWLAGRNGIDPLTYAEQAERFSDFFTRATIVSMKAMPFDLILGYQPIVDSAYHQFLLVDGNQLYFNSENATAAGMVRDRAYRAYDNAVARMRAELPDDTAFLTCGDHGMTVADTRIGINQLLADWGYAKRDSDKLAPDTPWAAFTSGSFAHIYHFGTADAKRTNELAKRLKDLRSPDGDLVFERVETKGPGANARAGDVVVYARPRYALSARFGGDTFAKTTSYGEHGSWSGHPELHTVLMAIGRTIPHQRVGAIPQTSIARFIAQLLRIAPPAGAQ